MDPASGYARRFCLGNAQAPEGLEKILSIKPRAFSWLELPDADGFVLAGSGKPFTIGAECDRKYIVGMFGKRLGQFCVIHNPKPDRHPFIRFRSAEKILNQLAEGISVPAAG